MLVENYSAGFLAANIGTSDTTISINPGHSLPTIVGGVFVAIIWNSGGYASPSQDPNAEIVWGQYFSPNTYTITRGMEGTPPVAHNAGALIGLYITAGVLSIPYIKVSETQPNGTPGQSPVSTANTWETAVLNTLDIDTARISSLGSNQLTLPAGTYEVEVFVPMGQVGTGQARLYNVTAALQLLLGTSIYAPSGAGGQGGSKIVGRFALLVSSAIAVQYQITNLGGSPAIGNNAGITTEVYTIMELKLVNT